MIVLGQKARDAITGIEGILTGRAQYLFGCDQYVIVPKAKDGKLSEPAWFDEGRIEILGKGVSASDVTIPGRPGGPQRDSPKRS